MPAQIPSVSRLQHQTHVSHLLAVALYGGVDWMRSHLSCSHYPYGLPCRDEPSSYRSDLIAKTVCRLLFAERRDSTITMEARTAESTPSHPLLRYFQFVHFLDLFWVGATWLPKQRQVVRGWVGYKVQCPPGRSYSFYIREAGNDIASSRRPDLNPGKAPSTH